MKLVQEKNTQIIWWKGYSIWQEELRKFQIVFIVFLLSFQTKTTPTQVRRKYIAAASLTDLAPSLSVPIITAWFNSEPYHSTGISFGLALNAIYRKQTKCDQCSINFFNYPQPYTLESQLELINGHTLGYQVAFYTGFSMAFVSSFFILSIVQEAVTKSKHLQFISGVKVYVFWLASIIFDLVVYFIIIMVFVLALTSLQLDGYSSADDLGEKIVLNHLYSQHTRKLKTHLLSY